MFAILIHPTARQVHQFSWLRFHCGGTDGVIDTESFKTLTALLLLRELL
jgi:hypothetical protein